jgi:hypothetical protein
LLNQNAADRDTGQSGEVEHRSGVGVDSLILVGQEGGP